MRTVVLLGANTALGRSIVEVLDEREVEADIRQAALTDSIGPGLDAIDEALLSEGELFVLTFSGPMADGLVEGLLRLGKPVLDLRDQDAREDAPYVWPGVNPDAGADLDGPRVLRISVGLASPVVALMQALAPLDPQCVQLSTYESAARFGQEGMDELSAQVRGVFTMQTVEPTVFAASLAFDAIPSLAGPEGDPFEADGQMEAAIEAGLSAVGLGGVEVLATRVLVPTFSAEAACVQIELAEPCEEQVVLERLQAARTLRWSEEDLMPSLDTVGRDDALVGRLKLRGRRLSLWLSADRLKRGSATQVALAVERWLQ